MSQTKIQQSKRNGECWVEGTIIQRAVQDSLTGKGLLCTDAGSDGPGHKDIQARVLQAEGMVSVKVLGMVLLDCWRNHVEPE